MVEPGARSALGCRRVCSRHLCDASLNLDDPSDWTLRCPRRAVNGQAYCVAHLTPATEGRAKLKRCGGAFPGGHWTCPNHALPGTGYCQQHYQAGGTLPFGELTGERAAEYEARREEARRLHS